MLNLTIKNYSKFPIETGPGEANISTLGNAIKDLLKQKYNEKCNLIADT